MEALSLGERVSRDGAFTSRRGTGEGSVVTDSRAVQALSFISAPHMNPASRPYSY